jgi:formate dehydrogenase alpha subunit
VASGRRVVILSGQGLLRAPRGYSAAVNLLDLLLLLGKLGQPGCGLASLAEENNDQGAVEMGAVAEMLPGPYDVSDRTGRARITGLWKDDAPPGVGASLIEMLDRAGAGLLKAMFIVGENPVASLPAQVRARESLSNVELLVCQELYLTETAALAHVVLPAASYMEKDGTFTNTEGHVQTVRHALDPVGEARPDWEVFSALSMLMGVPLEYGDSKELSKEIRSLILDYGSLGPAPLPPKTSRSAVERYLAEGYASDLDTRYRVAEATPRPQGTIQLELVQSLFHSGKLSTRSKGLVQLEGRPYLRLNAAEAALIGVTEGDRVRLSNARGEFTTEVRVVERVPDGLAWFPDHYGQDAAHVLDCVIDPETKVPYIRAASVSVTKVS